MGSNLNHKIEGALLITRTPESNTVDFRSYRTQATLLALRFPTERKLAPPSSRVHGSARAKVPRGQKSCTPLLTLAARKLDTLLTAPSHEAK
jgi:hypothetical protein